MVMTIAQELREWASTSHASIHLLRLDAWAETLRYRARGLGLEPLGALSQDDRRTFALLVAEALESEE